MPIGMPHIRTREPAGEPAHTAVFAEPEAVAGFLEDAAHFPGGHAGGVAFPRSEADITALMLSHARVLAIGAQSSLTGGATPMGEVVLSLTRMSRILDVSGESARVQPGVPLRTLQEALNSRGLYYPPVPTFTGASVGGTVATNAAGAATFKYGSTRAWVRSLTVVLASGEVLDIRRGEVTAHRDGYFDIESLGGTVRVPVPAYRMPAVPKRSAGYHAEPGMDLIDLFIGSEGTLGIITEITLKILRRPPSLCLAFVPLASERSAIALTGALRSEAQAAWESKNQRGIDIPAIEYLDARSLELGGAAASRAGIRLPPQNRAALLVQLELPAGTTAEQAYAEIGAFDRSRRATDSPLARFCGVLAGAGALESTELALPGDVRRFAQMIELREAVPAAVNEQVGLAKRTIDPLAEKVAGDLIVPFERLEEMLAVVREAFARRTLDHAVWGHISDGNLHPNVIPRAAGDVQAGKEALLETGHAVTRMGGCPLAEHGVGRSAVKQALLRQLYGDSGIEAMRAVKRALDPEWKLAPGVLFDP